MECLHPIERGEVYHVSTGIWEGEWRTFKTCWWCHLLQLEMWEGLDRYDEPPVFGALLQYCEDLDMICPIPR